jgi:predicted signal transduction protein with EAL and GGDEF domain
VQDDREISHYVIFFEDISERKAAERRIQDLAFYDELTGLPNRRQLHETLAHAFGDANRSHLIGALLFIDLDHFKTINDSLGHATGDWLLKEVASRLKRLVRQGIVWPVSAATSSCCCCQRSPSAAPGGDAGRPHRGAAHRGDRRPL